MIEKHKKIREALEYYVKKNKEYYRGEGVVYECPADNALTLLDEITATLESEELVMDMVISHNDSLCKERNADKAMRAAINSIKGKNT